MFVTMKLFDAHVNEINVKISTFKIGDGLIFGYVLRRQKVSEQFLTFASVGFLQHQNKVRMMSHT